LVAADDDPVRMVRILSFLTVVLASLLQQTLLLCLKLHPCNLFWVNMAEDDLVSLIVTFWPMMILTMVSIGNN
jgi:hypothetical protein